MVSRAEFEGRTVVITGAGGGLGSAIAALLAGRGARVVGCDQSEEALASPHLASRHVFDLLDRASVEAAVAAVLEKDGVPDIVINNAGWTRAETLDALTADRIEHELDLNLTGVMIFADPIAKAMAARGSGSVVFISSVNAIAHFGNPAYAAAKAGINAYAKSIAVELGRSGVRANVVCPGSIRTAAWDHRLAKNPDIIGKLQRLYPLGRIVNASEVAEAVAFLASDRASGVTGVVMPVDAGLTAGCLPFIDDILGA
ncbi:SDR family oxidoreductase [Mesorhizobium sp. M00.F.Ca.ET.151.01.1.1]|uniref:SDR family oxidoreductase n=1 Tax=unclassified Mesorhizobium TaxID=325217 RepID=UPI000FE93628|nr:MULTISPECIES: SDR family oxidoreductase [unclassified Mesorhizobium]RWC73248.1 MAG: SDR family oxidoreductase [Mesorhizobium sp.]TGU91097.1 SDR family oxidoreductase [Mesorhizobium sp. M00.F.Ca.ET.151.01.1.1]TGV10960.1 SDR family oxidoreductase [Mesorhizobium sp. M8A.F.Ca.ET.173.01.1.1]TGV56269.1 SDR family oxidoreductase [bacterium M00.F.Ca.ET.141.01.1.1]TGQ77599.1 SDR family oxidoreductase [Mesorhizobium sp. M8A.F.Ca.ET.207.01.1.1]